MRKAIRIICWSAAALAVYLIVGIVLSTIIFPAAQPDYSNYFRPGDKLVSTFEGFDQTVLAVNDGWLHGRLELRPNAAGPPEHFHEAFEETFTVKSGTLSILVNGKKRTLEAGETIRIPAMMNHKPFNETNETVVIESENPKSVPVQFGFILSQLYGFMDSQPGGPSTPEILMQLSVYGKEADSWIANGPPLAVQKAMRVLMAPTARLLGYRNYYQEYNPRNLNGGI